MAAETFLISFYGRKDLGTGCLRNLTNGGDGESGRIISPQQREQLRAYRTGKTMSEETCRKISNAIKGAKRSEETRHKMATAKMGNQITLGRHRPPSECHDIADRMRKWWAVPENKMKYKTTVAYHQAEKALELMVSVGS